MGGGRGPPRHGTLTWLATLQSKGEFNSLKEKSSQITLQQNVPFKEHKHQIHNIDIAWAHRTSMAKSRWLPQPLKLAISSSSHPWGRHGKPRALQPRSGQFWSIKQGWSGLAFLHCISCLSYNFCQSDWKDQNKNFCSCVPSPACSVLRKTGCRFLKATKDAQCCANKKQSCITSTTESRPKKTSHTESTGQCHLKTCGETKISRNSREDHGNEGKKCNNPGDIRWS